MTTASTPQTPASGHDTDVTSLRPNVVSVAARPARRPAGRIRISRTGPRTRPWKMRCNTCGIAVHHPTHTAAITLANEHTTRHQRLQGPTP